MSTTYATALGGEVIGGHSVSAPGPGHDRGDRSLSVKLSPSAPLGFVVNSFASDPFDVCQRYVAERLGLDREAWKYRRDHEGPQRAKEAHTRARERREDDEERKAKTASAVALWRASIDPRGTLVERYLNSRKLELGDDIANTVIRWAPDIGAMVCLFRNIESDRPQAVSRTFLDREGRKLDRKFLGPVGGAAIKLDADDTVLSGLHIGEGVETCTAARRLGLRPTWALGSAGAIARFQVLNGIESLTLLREHDEANARAADTLTARWQVARHEVFDAWPNVGKDVNDAIRGGAA